jgi:hypothetical protein
MLVVDGNDVTLNARKEIRCKLNHSDLTLGIIGADISTSPMMCGAVVQWRALSASGLIKLVQR